MGITMPFKRQYRRKPKTAVRRKKRSTLERTVKKIITGQKEKKSHTAVFNQRELTNPGYLYNAELHNIAVGTDSDQREGRTIQVKGMRLTMSVLNKDSTWNATLRWMIIRRKNSAIAPIASQGTFLMDYDRKGTFDPFTSNAQTVLDLYRPVNYDLYEVVKSGYCKVSDTDNPNEHKHFSVFVPYRRRISYSDDTTSSHAKNECVLVYYFCNPGFTVIDTLGTGIEVTHACTTYYNDL